jgi:hypothetical protein
MAFANSALATRKENSMRFLGFLVFLAAIILVVGLWRGWFFVDKEKIESDTQKAVQTIKDAGRKVFKENPNDTREQPK